MSVIIRLQNLPLTANASDVRNFFQGLAIPDGGVHIVGGELGDAFIAFSTDEDARQAMSRNGRQMKGVTISLLLSSRAEMQKVIEQARKAALAYMQLSRVVPTPVATPPKAVVSQLTTPTKGQPNFKAMAANPISAVAAAALSSLSATLTHGIPAAAAQHQQLKPQPPVISLAGFLGQSAPRIAAQTNELIVPSATASAVVSPLLTQSSLYQEIPGLSFLSSGPASTSGPVTVANSAVNSSGIAGWLSAMHEYRDHQQQPTTAPGVANTDLAWNAPGAFPGSGLLATGINTTPLLSSDRNGYATGTGESQWKMLNKPRRSRSPSGEPRRDQQRRSRSSSRDRDRRSSSRDRAFKRDSHSRSSSRDRRSRSSSREYSRRFRNSRSRSSSRDRFGRGRHQRSHSRSRDRNDSREPTNAYGDRTEPGRSTRVRASRFSDRYGDSRSPNQWSSMEQGFTGNAATQPMYGVGVPNQQSEPIFGLHTSTAMDQQRSRFQAQPGVFPARSGKISPPMPVYNGVAFRSTSPLPDSVYQSVKSPTSDFAVRITNLETSIGYGDIRRFFKQQPISTQGIKMINDLHGRRTGMAYLQFMRKEGKLAALQRDKAILRRAPLHIESITDQEFEQATDSYRPSGNDKPSQKWDDQRGGSGESFRRGRFGGRGNDNSDVIEIDDDQDDQQRMQQQPGQRQRQQQHGVRKPGEGHPPTSTLLVWNLPSFTTEQDIMKMFSDFTVVEVLIVKNHHIPKQLDGYVRFHRQEDAREAWQQEHRHYIINKRVTVRLCPEIDYEVAKNEYENPVADDNEPDTDARRCDSQVQEASQREPAGRGPGMGLFGSNFRQDSRDSGNRDGGSRVANPPSSFSTAQDAPNSASNDNNSDPDNKFFNEPYLESTAPWLLDRSRSWAEDDDQQQQRGMRSGSQDHIASPGDGMVAPWNDPELRANLGDFREESRLSDASETRHNFRDNDSENAGGFPSPSQRDPRRRGAGAKNNSSSAAVGAGVGGPCNNSNDSSELFQRTTCLLLRNVDFSVTEEDVYDFFVQDGFRPRNVLLVRDENDRRTGECLVEFESPSEAAHAESKSSQNLGRRKVFASHLDRGQVADLMQRFDAIAKHNEGRGTKGSSSRWQDGSRGGAGGGGGGGRRDARHDGGRESNGRTPDDDRRPSPPCAVGLLNLAYKTTVEDLQRFFRDFDLPLENIRRRFLDNGKPTGEAMIRFLSRHDAARAVDEYHNRSLFGRNVRMRLINDD